MNNPEFWNEIIQRVSQTDRLAAVTIAGGCLRDFWLGLEPKDIDVFVSYSRVRTPNDQIVHPEGFEFTGLSDHQEYPGANDTFVVANYLYKDTKIQVIHLHRAFDAHYATFDYNMTRARYDNARGMNLSPEWLLGYQRKEIILHPFMQEQLERTRARAEDFINRVSEIEDGWNIRENPEVVEFEGVLGLG